MYRFSAGLTAAAMLFALVSAPWFHIHDRDDHNAAVLHAHFLESEHSSSSSPALETSHSHDHVRWVDVFTLIAPVTAVFYAIAEISEPLPVPLPTVTRAVVSVQTVRVHGPPPAANLNPRSPPAL